MVASDVRRFLIEREVFEHTAHVLNVFSARMILEVLLVDFACLIDFVAFVVKATQGHQSTRCRARIFAIGLFEVAQGLCALVLFVQDISQSGQDADIVWRALLGLAQDALGGFELFAALQPFGFDEQLVDGT